MKQTFTKPLFALALLFCLPFALSAQNKSSDFQNPVPIPYQVEGKDTNGMVKMNLNFTKRKTNFDSTGVTSGGVEIGGGGKNLYDINQRVRTWGINNTGKRIPANAPDMTYLGPTLRWKRGTTVNVNFTNYLPTQSPQEPGQGQAVTNHWHGLNIPAHVDGGPHQPIFNNAGTWKPEFPVVDEAQSLWYHSHIMEYTTEQVIMGLAGMIIIEDTTNTSIVNLNNALPHDYGANDFPLVIQEKGFIFKTSTVTGTDTTLNTADSMLVSEKPGDGQFRVINGAALGYLKVPNSMVRFRILNGDTRKSYNIGFSTNIDTADTSSRLTFYQIATDGGYMGKAHPIQQFIINPGERGEFVVDFSSSNVGTATEVFLSNLASMEAASGTKDIVGLGGDKKNAGTPTSGLAFMKFTIDPNLSVPSPITSMPANSMFPTYALQNCPTPRQRTKRLQGGGGANKPWTIDGTGMDMMRLDDTVCVNTCEEWTIINETNVGHPFHIHKVQFQIKEYIDRSDSVKNPGSAQFKTYTFGNNLPSHMQGYKDVMIMRAYSQMTFQARFDDFPAHELNPKLGYMYHCHILTHEDFSMMHQFTVVSDSICKLVGLADIVAGEEGVFNVYPNPANDQLFIQGKADSRSQIQIIDLTGRVLMQQSVAPFKGVTSINIANLPKGLVLVNFVHDGHSVTKKILVE